MREKNNKHIIEENIITHLLRSSGHLPALTELELDNFEVINKDFSFKLKNIKIDPDKIMKGTFRKKIQITQLDPEIKEAEIRNLNMAARKGQDINDELMDKIKTKHLGLNKSNDK